MMQVMKIDSSLFRFATTTLKKDFDLALMAFADSRKNATTYLLNERSNCDDEGTVVVDDPHEFVALVDEKIIAELWNFTALLFLRFSLAWRRLKRAHTVPCRC